MKTKIITMIVVPTKARVDLSRPAEWLKNAGLDVHHNRVKAVDFGIDTADWTHALYVTGSVREGGVRDLLSRFKDSFGLNARGRHNHLRYILFGRAF